MKKLIALPLVLAAVGVAASGALAKPDSPKPNQVASQLCVAEKAADKAAFEATYGENAMRDCKRAKRAEAGETTANASQECAAERTADPAAFAEAYGTNGNDKNAFGKCVSSKVGPELAAEGEAFDNAAQECRAERTADPEGFTTTYGTNANGKNAFGKCVSGKAKAEEEAAPTA
jgi:hypothetical protein